MDKGNPCTLLVGLKIGAVIWETASRFLKKLRIELSSDPAISTSGIIQRTQHRVKRHMNP